MRPHESGQDRHLRPVVIDTDGLPEYPLGNSDRLTTHYFLAWHFDRWLNSELRLTASPAVRGLAFDLFNIAQRQTPVGTLPDDNRQLAALLLLDVTSWERYRAETPSPLHSWRPCLCEGGLVRLMHPVVLEVIEDAFGRRRKHEQDAEKAREAKRLHRLREAVAEIGTKRMAADDAMMERLDAWLVVYCDEQGKRRTRAWVQRAMEVDATKETS